MEITARALTPEAYAPYGEVVMASPRGEPGSPANQGTARRYDRIARVEDLRSGRAPLNVCVFRCSPVPRSAFPRAIALLERHPKSTQLFVPMNAARGYLVVVAGGGDAPDLATLAAFVASPAQGVSYRPGVWHHPMIALDDTTDFACFVHEDGGADDCDVAPFAEAARPTIALPP